MMIQPWRISGLAVLALLASSAGDLSMVDADGGPGAVAAEVVRWASSEALPIATVTPGSGLADLEPLRKVIGGAEIVMLGESRHDAREHFLLKHRVIEFLVQEMGFTVLAMEESAPQADAITDYLLGGDGDPEALVAQMGGWYIWGTEEFLGLVRWLRKHNDDPGCRQKVRLSGLDISDAPLPAIRQVLAYLGRVDPALAAELRAGIDLRPFSPDFWPQSLENYGRLSPGAIDSLGQGLGRMIDVLIGGREHFTARSDAAEYERCLHLARIARKAHEMFATIHGGDFTNGGLIRERAMVDHLLHLRNQVAPGERIIVWAHNVHIARGPLDLNIPPRPPVSDMRMMGQLLDDRTGAKVVTIGFAFGRGVESHADLPPADEESLDAILARTGRSLFILDLRPLPADGPVRAWFREGQTMRAEGGFVRLVPAEAFDALIFTETLTRTRPTARVIARFEALQGG